MNCQSSFPSAKGNKIRQCNITSVLGGNWVILWNMADSSALLTSPLSSSKSRVLKKRCVVKYCDKKNADHVSLFQFPDNVKHRSVFDQWVKFVEVMRDSHSWSRGAGYVYVCSDHFTPETDYENLTNLKYGYQTIPKLNKEATVPSKRPVPTPG